MNLGQDKSNEDSSALVRSPNLIFENPNSELIPVRRARHAPFRGDLEVCTDQCWRDAGCVRCVLACPTAGQEVGTVQFGGLGEYTRIPQKSLFGGLFYGL